LNPAGGSFSDLKNPDALPEARAVLRQWLPADLEALAREKAFLTRRRGRQDADRWLRLILMHVAGGLSLKQTVRAWMQAKILVALLIEKVPRGGRFFPPWGYPTQRRESMAVLP
jgi:hypothetical protein